MKKIKLEELKMQSFITSLNDKQAQTLNGALAGSNNNCYNTEWTCWADTNGDTVVNNGEPIISYIFTVATLCSIIESINDSMTGK